MRVVNVRVTGSRLAWLVAISIALGACGPSATKGTLPPPGLDGEIEPADAPDFIAVAGNDEPVIGYVRKAFVLSGGGPGGVNEPVYAEDLQTVIGHMVLGKGFVPLGVDPATVPDIPVVVAPSFDAAAPPVPAVAIYVRNQSDERIWFAERVGDLLLGGGAFDDAGVSSTYHGEGEEIVVVDRSPQGPGVRVLRSVYARGESNEDVVLGVNVSPDGEITQGSGVPEWWRSNPQRCSGVPGP